MAEPFVMDTDLTLGSRLVWVLNRDSVSYTENFKGVPVTVPPFEKKELKMPFLEARQFLGQGKPPAKQDAQGNWLIRPKALYTSDLTKEEKLGTINEVIEKNAHDAEKASVNKCMICNKVMTTEHALKVHIANMHEGADKMDGAA
jgi:hypothetical protein